MSMYRVQSQLWRYQKVFTVKSVTELTVNRSVVYEYVPSSASAVTLSKGIHSQVSYWVNC